MVKQLGEVFEIIKNYTWQSFRKELINDDTLMMNVYQRQKN
jgi:hypothetical protein